MLSLSNISKSWSKLKKDTNIEKLAQFEKTRHGFGGTAPNKLEVQGVVLQNPWIYLYIFDAIKNKSGPRRGPHLCTKRTKGPCEAQKVKQNHRTRMEWCDKLLWASECKWSLESVVLKVVSMYLCVWSLNLTTCTVCIE